MELLKCAVSYDHVPPASDQNNRSGLEILPRALFAIPSKTCALPSPYRTQALPVCKPPELEGREAKEAEEAGEVKEIEEAEEARGAEELSTPTSPAFMWFAAGARPSGKKGADSVAVLEPNGGSSKGDPNAPEKK